MKRRPSGSRKFDLGAVPHEVFSVSLCGVTDEMAAHTVPVALCGRGAVIAEDYGLFDVVFEVGGDIVGDDKYARPHSCERRAKGQRSDGRVGGR